MNRLVPVLAVVLLLLPLITGCAKATVTTPSTTFMNGTYLLQAATCNGTQATGSVAMPTAPTTETMIFSGTTGVASIVSSSCTISYPFTASYPAGETVTVTPTGTINCTPAACSGSCSLTAPTTAYTYSVILSSVSLNLDGAAGNTRCSDDGQSDPVTLTFSKQ